MTWTEENRQQIDLLPPHMREAAIAYVEEGRHPGGFLYAIFTNDLVEAYSSAQYDRADIANNPALETWAAFLYHAAPYDCWGSGEIILEWMAHGGLTEESCEARLEREKSS